MIVVILPTYNEERAILPLLEHFSKVFESHFPKYRLIVVNDGSSDNTAAVTTSYRDIHVELIEHEKNRGLGEAIKTGLLYVIKDTSDDDIIVLMDSDNTHSPGLISRMVMLIEEGNDVVIASRYVPGAKVVGLSFARQMCSLGASLLFRILLPVPGVRDYTCSYRAYRAGILKKALERYGNEFVSLSGFSSIVDILLKLEKLNAIITEVPLILRYDLKPGKSKMNVKKMVLETISLVFNHWFKLYL